LLTFYRGRPVNGKWERRPVRARPANAVSLRIFMTKKIVYEITKTGLQTLPSKLSTRLETSASVFLLKETALPARL
jgi:hypothetical protein